MLMRGLGASACTALLATLFFLNINACRTERGDKEGSQGLSATAPNPQAVAAMKVIGKFDGTGANAGSCADSNCHNVDQTQVSSWAKNMQSSEKKCFESGLSAAQTVDCIKNENLGFYRAGVNMPEFQQLFKDAYGESAGMIEHRQFYEIAIMPAFFSIGNGHEELSAADFKIVKDWVLSADGDPPGLAEVFGAGGDNGPLSDCTDTTSSDLAAYLKARGQNYWTMRLVQEPTFEPLGCPADFKQKFAADPIAAGQSCFKQTRVVNGKDIKVFTDATEPEAKAMGLDWTPVVTRSTTGTNASTSEWVTLTAETHVLKKLPYKTFYWMRSSVDGRFVGNGIQGGAASCSGASAVIEDLRPAKLDNGTLRERIYVNGRYDPGFFPNNAGFTMHGVGGDAAFCNMKLLTTKPYPTCVDLIQDPKAKRYCGIDDLNVYQHVGVSLDGDDLFVARGTYENDNGAFDRTTDAPVSKFAGAQTAVEVFKLAREVSSSADRYKRAQEWKVLTPNHGDWSISPSSKLLLSRVSGPSSVPNDDQTMQGYGIHELYFDNGEAKLKDIGRVCLKGTKASMSSNERILTTHHYVDVNDQAELGLEAMDVNVFKTKYVANSSNIYIKDLCSGRKARITNMGPGQFALFPHFRADGWLYYLIRDMNNQPGESGKVEEFVMATDAALEMQKTGTCGG